MLSKDPLKCQFLFRLQICSTPPAPLFVYTRKHCRSRVSRLKIYRRILTHVHGFITGPQQLLVMCKVVSQSRLYPLLLQAESCNLPPPSPPYRLLPSHAMMRSTKPAPCPTSLNASCGPQSRGVSMATVAKYLEPLRLGIGELKAVQRRGFYTLLHL